jgi:uncharacterized RDD family membrane protein YckC
MATKNIHKNKPKKPKKSSSKSSVKNTSATSKTTKTEVKKQYPVMGGFFERFLAFIVDSLIIGFVGQILWLFLAAPMFFTKPFMLGMRGYTNPYLYFFSPFIFLGGLFLGVGLTFLYYGYFYTKSGQTLGKKLLNLRVVDATSLKNITWGATFMREILGKWLSKMLFYLGFLWYFMSPKRQTWADSVANTYVVKAEKDGKIVLGDVDNYKKQPFITFGCCGCFLVITVVSFIILIGTVIFSAKLIGDAYQKNKQPYQNLPGVEKQGPEFNLDKDFNVKPDNYENIEDLQEEMEKMMENMIRESEKQTEFQKNSI